MEKGMRNSNMPDIGDRFFLSRVFNLNFGWLQSHLHVSLTVFNLSKYIFYLRFFFFPVPPSLKKKESVRSRFTSSSNPLLAR